MEEKLRKILDLVKTNCDDGTYMEAYLIASGGHYDDKSGAHALSQMHYRNGSPKEAGIELNSLYGIVKARAAELAIDTVFTNWDAMVYVAKAFSVHWISVAGDLETAVTLALEEMVSVFGTES